ncbi:sterol desaturase family protein [Bauldia sp.]|uniref:sterol desaturase family protein n=1 Tax=Bauldia sp. TaxID=2575872 RepID=UPI003BAA3432
MTVSDSAYGKEDSRGHWSPNKPPSYGPFFDWPPNPRVLFKWFFGFPGYFLPWNVLFAVAAILIWTYLTPSLETLQTFSLWWVALILLRNLGLTLFVYGAWHLWLYVWRKQGTLFKYNRQWPKEKSSVFKFGNQTYDNMFYTLVSGVSIWTAYEVLLLWAYANNIAPYISFAEYPVLFVAIFFLVPFIHEVGFYFAHRLLHWPPLYKLAHAVHHRNVNPGPWSGLSMHPIEHVLYFATILLFFIIPSHPIHMINLASRLGLMPAQGHTGFDRVVVGDESTMDTSYYAHYLHHKYFEVNYSDGMVPLDRWFGSFHDGTPEAQEAMLARRTRRGV